MTLRAAATFVVQVYEAAGATANDQGCHGAGDSVRAPISTTRVMAPLTQAASRIAFDNDGTFVVPVPRGAPFGSNTLKLVLTESGAVQTLGYGNTSGTAAALNAVGTLGGALIETDAEAAARYQGQASRAQNQRNLIVQQRLLIACQIDPTECD